MQTPVSPSYNDGRYQWILNHRKWIFWICLAGGLITGYLQLTQNKLLKNEAAPEGLRSLQKLFSVKSDTSIVASWQEVPVEKHGIQDGKKQYDGTLVNIAGNNIFIDFIFILFYTGFAIVVIVWLRQQEGTRGNRWTKYLVWLAVLAGLLDAVENAGMLLIIIYTLYGRFAPFIHAVVFIKSVAAWTKFLILIGLFVYVVFTIIFKRHGLVQLSTFLRIRREQLYRYRVIILGIAVFTLAIWVSDQGQDLLINVNAKEWGVISFLGIIYVIALLNWYLAKLFFENNKRPEVYPFNEPPGTPEEKKVSRILGVATILAPAAAILNALKATRVDYPLDVFPPEAWLIFLLVIFYLLIKFDVACRVMTAFGKKLNSEKKAAGYLILLAIFIAVVFPLIIRLTLWGTNHQPASLIWLYWDMIFLATGFYIVISVRSAYFKKEGLLGERIGVLVFLLATGSALLFILLNVFPLVFAKASTNYITLPALQAGVICYIFVFTIIIRLSQRLQINFLLLLVFIAITASFTGSSYHMVRRTVKITSSLTDSTTQKIDSSTLSSLEGYFRQWVLSRRSAIEADENYPVFLVNTYGGGIRAAAFHSIVINWLDSVFMQRHHKSFENYCFSVSGASGGTIGAAVQAAYYDLYKEDPNRLRPGAFIGFYQRDFLSPLLLADIGRDFIAGSFSVGAWHDRAYITDAVWSNIARTDPMQITLDSNYTKIWQLKYDSTDYRVPLLFSNTLNVDDGLKGICAPLPLSNNDFPATVFIRQLQDSLNARRDKMESPHEVSLITGAFLSARFPYLSPSGKMGAGYHFIDGGGKDNSGAGTSELIFAALGRYADSVRQQKPLPLQDSVFYKLLGHIHFYFVSINSSAHTNEPRKLVDNRFEPISPIVGIVNSGIDGNAQAADKTLLIRYGNNDSLKHLGFHTSYFNIYPSADTIVDPASKRAYVPVLPLGWQISDPALRRLLASFDSTNIDQMGDNGILKLLDVMKGKEK